MANLRSTAWSATSDAAVISGPMSSPGMTKRRMTYSTFMPGVRDELGELRHLLLQERAERFGRAAGRRDAERGEALADLRLLQHAFDLVVEERDASRGVPAGAISPYQTGMA